MLLEAERETRTWWRWVLFSVFLFGFILIPFALFEGRMNALVQHSLQSGGSLSLITLAVIGFLTVDIALPIPSSFVLSTTGYMLASGRTRGARPTPLSDARHARRKPAPRAAGDRHLA